jgi:predicted phosphodiesterase
VRIALIADVHGNLPALDVALRELRADGFDRLLCAGDLVGYGPFPNECVTRIAEEGAVCVAGNHDLMAIGRLDDAHAGALARTTLEWTRGVLGADARGYLESLPFTATLEAPSAELGRLVMAHGSLHDPMVYVEAARAADELRRLAAVYPDASMLVLGHTHRPLAHGGRRGKLVDGRAGDVQLEAGEALLVNPGSVGQPREWRALVRFALLDLDARAVRYRALDYDQEPVRSALLAAGLPADACHRRPPLRRVVRRALSRR